MPPPTTGSAGPTSPCWPWGPVVRPGTGRSLDTEATGIKAMSVGMGGTSLPPRPVTTHCQAVLAGVGTRTGHEGRSGHSIQLPGLVGSSWGSSRAQGHPGRRTGSGRRWGRLPPAGPHGHGGGWASEQLTWNSTPWAGTPRPWGGGAQPGVGGAPRRKSRPRGVYGARVQVAPLQEGGAEWPAVPRGLP